MTMPKMSFIVAGAVLAALSVSPSLAQEADGDTMFAPDGDNVFFAQVSEPGDMEDWFAMLAAVPDGPSFPAVAAAPGLPGGPPVLLAGQPDRDGPPGGGPRLMFHRPGGPPNGPFGTLTGPLALSDDQWEKLYQIREDSMEHMGPKMLQMHQTMHHLMDALASPDQDTKKIKDLQSQLASLRADMSSAETSKLVAMSQVLTADQRAAIHKAMIKHAVMGGMMGGHGHMGGHGGPPHPPMGGHCD
jgi:Spy/CpxP family protein refolding chaperone